MKEDFPMPTFSVVVVPHQQEWSQQFAEEAARLRALLGDEVVAIHHIGSTAIPTIFAKPIIDLLVEVHSVVRLDALAEKMESADYQPRGEYGLIGRRYFTKPIYGIRTHHIHCYTTDHPALLRHLVFRDYMLAHPETAEAYSQLKQRLALLYPTNRQGYMDGKDPFIKEVESKMMGWYHSTIAK